jgi:hypothetical protein
VRVNYRKMSDEDILNLEHPARQTSSGQEDRPVDHWVTINHHHVPITLSHGTTHGKCPPQKKAFFDALGGLFKTMGRAANTDPAFIAALAAYESSWLGKHARDLHNPFGLTAGGGNDLSFPTYDAAANYWLYHAGRDRKGFASIVSGMDTIEEFASALNAAGYNAVNPNWTSDIAKVYRTSIAPFGGSCGF